MRLEPQPHVSWQALTDLSQLLHDCFGGARTKSRDDASPPAMEGSDATQRKRVRAEDTARSVRPPEPATSMVRTSTRHPKEADGAGRAIAGKCATRGDVLRRPGGGT
jgi:hypothetical protein